jgi:radical SAM protein with 4Fe4S-binding SPASM domain
MVRKIAFQVKQGTVVQFHNNGEPLLYPYLEDALSLFTHCIRQFNTNGILLMEKSNEIIGNLEVLTISVIEGDDAQYETVCRFLDRKGTKKPNMVYRLLGDVEKADRWEALQGIVARRVLHAAGGSYSYEKKVTIPEDGICRDLLTHLAIDRYGNISVCVRFDPNGRLGIGNINEMSLAEAWKSDKRKKYIQNHINQRRDLCPGCDQCDFYGVPIGN